MKHEAAHFGTRVTYVREAFARGQALCPIIFLDRILLDLLRHARKFSRGLRPLGLPRA